MRHQGRITRWLDDKGYGYVTWHGGGEPLFIHVKSFPAGSRRPAVGDIVVYEQGKDERGRPCAIRAHYPRKVHAPAGPDRSKAGQWWAATAVLFVIALCVAVAMGRVPVLVLGVYAAASVLAFITYGLDKSAAQRSQWRVQESTLLLMGLVGGWPGSVAAQRIFRHKSQKSSFMWAFLGVVLLNIVALLLFSDRVPREMLSILVARLSFLMP